MQPEYPIHDKLSGRILIASPGLVDPNFHQTLVYLAEHDRQGALGLVLNRPMGKKLGEVVTKPDLSEKLADIPVYLGGPVKQGQLLLAYFEEGKDDQEIICNLHNNLEQLEAWLDNGQGWVRAYTGFSGWGEGQLESELAQDSWKVSQAEPALFDERLVSGLWSVFISGDDRWRKLLPYFPRDPLAN